MIHKYGITPEYTKPGHSYGKDSGSIHNHGHDHGHDHGHEHGHDHGHGDVYPPQIVQTKVKKSDIETLNSIDLYNDEINNHQDYKSCFYELNERPQKTNQPIINDDISSNDIFVESDILFDFKFMHKINTFLKHALWKQNELSKGFIIEFKHNLYSETLFYNNLLPKINVLNDKNVHMDYAYITCNGFNDIPNKWSNNNSNHIKIMINCNNTWDTLWGGGWDFYEETKKLKIRHVDVAPGRAIIFNNNILHKLSSLSNIALNLNKYYYYLIFEVSYE